MPRPATVRPPGSVALTGHLAHNSGVPDDAADGRPWPIDPVPTPPRSGALPVPELGGSDDPADVLSEFAGHTDGPPSSEPTSAGQEPAGVTDEDRNNYGVLPDHAAERGLLSTHEYEVRLGELAAATSLDEMRRIVTELPAFTAVAATPSGSRRPSPVVGPDPAAAAGHRRSGPWVVLGMLVVVIVAAMIVLAIYAEHMIRSHSAGLITPVVLRSVSALRL